MILEALRSRSSSILVKGLMVLLIISFAAWGIGDYLSPRGGTGVVAKIGSTAIQTEIFERELQNEIARLRQALGPRFDRDQAKAFGVPQMVLNRMIEEALLDQTAARLGVIVTDDQVRAAIQSDPGFKGPAGGFDRGRFRQFLSQIGMNETYYTERLRQDLARRALAQSLVGYVAAPSLLAETLYRQSQEKRTVEWAFVADKGVPAPTEPSEGDLAEFHKSHAKEFTAPEYRGLTAIRLAPDDMAREISVPETELKEAYESRAEEYRKPERRHLQQVLTRDEASAKRAHDLLAQGRDVADVAREVAGMAPEATDLGLMARDQMLPEIADAAYAATKGAVLAPIKSPLGWHVIQIAAVESETVRTFAEVRDDLAKTLAREKAIDGLVQLANKIEDALGGGAALEEAAARLNLKPIKIEAVDREGRGPDGKPVGDMPAGDGFLEQAFVAEAGRDSGVVDAGDNGYFVVRVDKIVAPALKPLSEVRVDATEKWRAAKRSDAAGKQASDLAAAARESGSLTIAGAARNIAVQTAAVTKRTDNGPLPPPAREALFQLRAGEVGTARGADGRFVFRLVKIERPDPAVDPRGVAAIADQATAALRNDLAVQLAEGLRRVIPVTLEQANLERLFR